MTVGQESHDGRKVAQRRWRWLLLAAVCSGVFLVIHRIFFVEQRIRDWPPKALFAKRFDTLLTYYGTDRSQYRIGFWFEKDGDTAYYAEHFARAVPLKAYWRRGVYGVAKSSNPRSPTEIWAEYSQRGSLVAGHAAFSFPLTETQGPVRAQAIAQFDALVQPLRLDRPETMASNLLYTRTYHVAAGRVVDFAVDVTPPQPAKGTYDRNAELAGSIRSTFIRFRDRALSVTVFFTGLLALLKQRSRWRVVLLLWALLGVWFVTHRGGSETLFLAGLLVSMASLWLSTRLLKGSFPSQMAQLFRGRVATGDTPTFDRLFLGIAVGTGGMCFSACCYWFVVVTGQGWISLQAPFGNSLAIDRISLSEVVGTVFWEEVVFRVALIPLLFLLTRRVGIAIVVSAVCWSFGHISAQSVPLYLRVPEVTIIGIAYGVLYLRYGLASVLMAHFAANQLATAAGAPLTYWVVGGSALLSVLGMARVWYHRSVNRPPSPYAQEPVATSGEGGSR